MFSRPGGNSRTDAEIFADWKGLECLEKDMGIFGIQ